MPMTETLRRDAGRASPWQAALLFEPAAPGRRPQAGKNDFDLHAYVGADPVNAADPSGLTPQAVICTGTRLGCPVHHDSSGGGLNPASSGTSDHVGRTNWAAVKRDPNPVPFTITGTINGADGTFTGTVTLGGRFEGITASINTAQFAGLMWASSKFSDGRILHEPTGDGMFGASPIWWGRLDSINGGKFSSYLGRYLEAIISGAVSGTRGTLEGPKVGLPGGSKTFYQRYDIPGSAAFPDVFSGARIAWQHGSPLIYLGPYHGDPHPLVPQRMDSAPVHCAEGLTSMEIWWLGLVHFLDEVEDRDEAGNALSLQGFGGNFKHHLLAEIDSRGNLLVVDPGDRDPSRLMVLVDKIEDIIIDSESEMRENLCLVECQLPGAATVAAFNTIFGIIDCLQRIALHFNLKDDCLKLIFVRRAEGKQ